MGNIKCARPNKSSTSVRAPCVLPYVARHTDRAPYATPYELRMRCAVHPPLNSGWLCGLLDKITPFRGVFRPRLLC
jgi:hypothetical protein